MQCQPSVVAHKSASGRDSEIRAHYPKRCEPTQHRAKLANQERVASSATEIGADYYRTEGREHIPRLATTRRQPDMRSRTDLPQPAPIGGEQRQASSRHRFQRLPSGPAASSFNGQLFVASTPDGPPPALMRQRHEGGSAAAAGSGSIQRARPCL
eukprot:gene304-33552_t